MSEPTTEAGRTLLRSDFDATGWGPNVVREHVERAILAIEAEAAAQERERLTRWTSEEVHAMTPKPAPAARDAARADADRLAEALRRISRAARSVSVLGPGALSVPDTFGSLVEADSALAAHEEARR